MQIDPRLNDIDDCLYRVAIRVLIMKGDSVLVVKEVEDWWWAVPGGGVDYGETIESTLTRKVEEELGVPAEEVISDFQIAHYNIGSVVNGVPRMNLFCKAVVAEELLKQTTHVAEWRWVSRLEFLELPMNPSYDKAKLAGVIWTKENTH